MRRLKRARLERFAGRLARLVSVLACGAVSGSAAEFLPPGYNPLPLGTHALVGARVFVAPGRTLASATIVIRDGLISAVGESVKPPADARVWDLRGAHVYAGFMDPYVLDFADEKSVRSSDSDSRAAGRDGDLTAGRVPYYGVTMSEPGVKSTRAGSEVARVHPQRRMALRYSADPKLLETLRGLGFTVGNFVPAKGLIKGTSALVSLREGDPDRLIVKPDVFQHAALELSPKSGDRYPASLMGEIAVVRQSLYDAQHDGLDQQEWRDHPRGRVHPAFNPASAALQEVLSGKTPLLFESDNVLMLGAVARIAAEFHLPLYAVATGEEWRRPDIIPAEISLVTPLAFPELPKISQSNDWEDVTLDALRAWDWAPGEAALLQSRGVSFSLTTSRLADRKEFRKNLRAALDRGFSEEEALASLTVNPAKLCGVLSQLGTIEPGKLADLTVVDGDYFDPEKKVRAVWIDGRYYRVDFSPAEKAENPKKKEARRRKMEAARERRARRVAQSPQRGRGPLASPETIVIHGATVWTCGPEGVITNASIFIEDGVFKRISRTPLLKTPGIPDPPDLEIDASGQAMTPGIIDCHSHAMILGDVNEATLPSTAMVRIGDVIDSESRNFELELAGGVTTVNLLHGSANPIGGQNCVIKLRNGALPDDLKFRGAPPGIKFALGENVKQSNWGEKYVTRFPQTRMGVRAFIENRFVAAQNYQKEWRRYRAQGGVPPRRDLELDAISEILEGKRLIHCHCYRQDEILAFLRLMEHFGVHVATLQHVLEGYKIADEIARDGAGASTFSDWWAYKFEVYDAIPYNGSLMRERGVLVSFNSDDPDLARRLYLEAAKAVKYGGTPEVEALKFVTLNPAKQLRIDHWVGSIEPGKDADFVLWSKPPLDDRTVCLETWIGGKKYFDRAAARRLAERRAAERRALIAKAKEMAEEKPDANAPEKNR